MYRMEGDLIKVKCPPLQSPSDFQKVKWSKEDYNKEPVFYCKKCLSLAIIAYNEAGISEYCNNCGSTTIGITQIENWQKLYNEKYHK